jgi:hypothetical protein
MIKKLTLYNPTQEDIIDYNVAEAVLNSEGDTIYDEGTGSYKETGVTLEWTLRAGESASFPKYVAEYLKKIYDFLEIKEEKAEKIEAEKKEVIADAKSQTGMVSCKYCGKNFKNERGLGLHIGHTHLDKIL